MAIEILTKDDLQEVASNLIAAIEKSKRHLFSVEIDTKEAAVQLNTTTQTIRNLVERGKLKSVSNTKNYRFTLDEIEKYRDTIRKSIT